MQRTITIPTTIIARPNTTTQTKTTITLSTIEIPTAISTTITAIQTIATQKLQHNDSNSINDNNKY